MKKYLKLTCLTYLIYTFEFSSYLKSINLPLHLFSDHHSQDSSSVELVERTGAVVKPMTLGGEVPG